MTAQIIDLEKAKLTIINRKSENKPHIAYKTVAYDALDLSIPLTEDSQKAKLENIFGWALSTMLHKNLDIENLENADERRKDFEKVLDAAFADPLEAPKISSGERAIILDMYYEMWKNVWKAQARYPDVAILLRNIKAKGPIALKYVADKELGNIKPEEYIRKNDGKIWECDSSCDNLEKSTRQSGKGYLFVAENDIDGFPPIDIIKSLAVLAKTRTAWNEEKLLGALERYHLTTPVMIKVNKSKVLVFKS